MADWIQAIGTWALFAAAVWAGCTALKAFRSSQQQLNVLREQLSVLREQSTTQVFSTLLEEITGDEASHDRGLVREKIDEHAKVKTIRDYVKEGRDLSEKIRRADIMKAKPPIDDEKLKKGLIGIGIERTIARYDRVAFLLLDDKNKFRMKPPDWVLGDINMIWLKLHNWIKYRRATKEKDFRNLHYARDLERLYYLVKNPEFASIDLDRT